MKLIGVSEIIIIPKYCSYIYIFFGGDMIHYGKESINHYRRYSIEDHGFVDGN